jgi:hypothetical protein
MNPKKDQVLNIVLGALVVVAVILGLTLIKNDEKKNLADKLTPPVSNSTATPNLNLTEEEMAVLKTPTPDSSEEERQKHFELAASLAVSTGELDLTGCDADPLVLKTGSDKKIKVVNNGNNPVEMVFDPVKRFTIPAAGFAVLSDIFDRGPGLYGYGCDASPSATGLFFVTE